MSYSTVSQFLSVYPKLNTIPPDTIQAFLDRAAADIDSYVSKVLTLPVTPAPPLLVSIEQDLAATGILRRNLAEASKDSAIETVHKDAIAKLEEIRDGKIDVLSSSGAALTPTTGGALWSNVENYAPTFGAGPIEDAEIDPDRTDAEEAAR
jgi:phage gp36-like protein